MDQQPKPTETQPPDSLSPSQTESRPVDLTRICWTQLLRETESTDKPPLLLPISPDDFSDDKLFS